MKKSLVPFALTMLGLLQNNAYAACSVARPLDCVSNPGSIGASQRLGEYRVSVKNVCNKVISVGAYYQPKSGSSTLSCVGCEQPEWEAEGFWNLNPGESAYILNTTNKFVYFTAFAQDGTAWGDERFQWDIQGQRRTFFEVSMGNSFTNYTHSFSCN